MIAIDVLAIRVLPHAEAYKPVPRLAAIIDRDRTAGDVVAIQSVSGGNALLFYTRPVVQVLAPPSDGDPPNDGVEPRSFICAAPRAWVIVPASSTSRTIQPMAAAARSSPIDRKAALLLV